MTACKSKLNGFQSRLDRLEDRMKTQATEVTDMLDGFEARIAVRINIMDQIIKANGHLMTERIDEAKAAMHDTMAKSLESIQSSIAAGENVFTDMVASWGSKLDVKQETFSQQMSTWKEELHHMLADISSRQKFVEKQISGALQRIPGPVQFGTVAASVSGAVSHQRGRSLTVPQCEHGTQMPTVPVYELPLRIAAAQTQAVQRRPLSEDSCSRQLLLETQCEVRETITQSRNSSVDSRGSRSIH